MTKAIMNEEEDSKMTLEEIGTLFDSLYRERQRLREKHERSLEDELGIDDLTRAIIHYGSLEAFRTNDQTPVQKRDYDFNCNTCGNHIEIHEVVRACKIYRNKRIYVWDPDVYCLNCNRDVTETARANGYNDTLLAPPGTRTTKGCFIDRGNNKSFSRL